MKQDWQSPNDYCDVRVMTEQAATTVRGRLQLCVVRFREQKIFVHQPYHAMVNRNTSFIIIITFPAVIIRLLVMTREVEST